MHGQTPEIKINYNTDSVSVSPVTEEEVQVEVNKLKVNFLQVMKKYLNF